MNATLAETRHSAAHRPSVQALLAAWIHRFHSRRQLAELDDRMLSDVGLTRDQVLTESRKAFWLS